jgi:hypothetical protein
MDDRRDGIGSPKKQKVPVVNTYANTSPGLTTVAESPDDSQHTLLTNISTFGDSIPLLFLSKRDFLKRIDWPSNRDMKNTITQKELLWRIL